MKYLVVGTGRCGTGYMSKILSSSGILCGHELKLKHKNQIAWVIGKGPSLHYLKHKHIEQGPVITLNHAILAIEALNLSNSIYSLQKDSGHIIPKKATLLLHDKESGNDFLGYPDRFVFSLESLGIRNNVFSLVFAVRIAQFMGCTSLRLLCCDLHVNGDKRTYIPGEGITKPSKYPNNQNYLSEYLKEIEHSFITPQKE